MSAVSNFNSNIFTTFTNEDGSEGRSYGEVTVEEIVYVGDITLDKTTVKGEVHATLGEKIIANGAKLGSCAAWGKINLTNSNCKGEAQANDGISLNQSVVGSAISSDGRVFLNEKSTILGDALSFDITMIDSSILGKAEARRNIVLTNSEVVGKVKSLFGKIIISNCKKIGPIDADSSEVSCSDSILKSIKAHKLTLKNTKIQTNVFAHETNIKNSTITGNLKFHDYRKQNIEGSVIGSISILGSPTIFESLSSASSHNLSSSCCSSEDHVIKKENKEEGKESIINKEELIPQMVLEELIPTLVLIDTEVGDISFEKGKGGHVLLKGTSKVTGKITGGKIVSS